MHHVGEINCQTLKKKDSFWNNIPPGQCDPYSKSLPTRQTSSLKVVVGYNSIKYAFKAISPCVISRRGRFL